MATEIAVQTTPGCYVTTGTELTFEAFAPTMEFKCTNSEIIHVRNGGAGPESFTVASVADKFGRTQDIVTTVPPGKQYIVGPMKQHGFLDSGFIQLTTSDADLEIAIVKPKQ